MATTTTRAVKTANGPQVGPYIFGKTLGTGSTGKVKLAKHVDTGEYVAVKIVRKDFLDRKPSLKRKLQREITVMKLCDHPNVLKLLDVFEIETHLFLVIEYVDGCELFEYLVRRGSLPPDEALRFFQQIICGLEYCHKRLICHRDLKPENLLLDRDFNVKVADFGMTSLNPPGSFLETSCGSPHYAAPEVVSGEMYNGLEADIWSTGVILYAMLTGRLPFDDDNIQRLLNKVQRGVYHMPSDIPPECKSLVRAMLTVDPSKRITIDGIKQHEWFRSHAAADCPVDDFSAPDDPITDPEREVVQGLVDLEWGSAEKITSELAADGSNLEKVFYFQLARHPMFRRNKGSADAAPAPAEHPTRAPATAADWVPPQWKNPDQTAKSQTADPEKSTDLQDEKVAEVIAKTAQVSVSEKGEKSAADPDTEVDTSKLPPHVVALLSGMKDGASTITGDIPKSTSLVRQADIVKRATEPESGDVEKTGTGDERSWFGGFKAVFGGNGGGNGRQ